MVAMTAADDAQWQAIARWKAERFAPQGRVTSWWGRSTGQVIGTAGDVLGAVPGVAGLGRVVIGGLGRLIDVGAGPAAASVRTGPVVERYRACGCPVDELDDVRELPLADLRAVMPRLGGPYAVAGGVQAVGSSLLASSGTVLTVTGGVGTAGVAVAPGVGAVLMTMALDAALGVLVSTRAIAHVAAYHGYEVADPQERLFALGVLSLGLAADNRREAAYRELTGVARGLARRHAWRLTAAQATTVVRTVSASLALRLTQERVAQVVPVIGTVVGVRRSVRNLRQVVDDAEHLYAERLLRERYGVPLEESDADEHGEIAEAVESLAHT